MMCSTTNSPISLLCYTCYQWKEITEADRLPHLQESGYQRRTNCTFICKSCNEATFDGPHPKFMFDEFDYVLMLQTIFLNVGPEGLSLPKLMDIIKNCSHLNVFDWEHFAKTNVSWEDRVVSHLEGDPPFFTSKPSNPPTSSGSSWHFSETFLISFKVWKCPKVGPNALKFDERTTNGPTMALFQPLVETNIKAIKLNRPSQQSWQVNASASSSGFVIGSFQFTIGVMYFEVEIVKIAKRSVVKIGIAPEGTPEKCSSKDLETTEGIYCLTNHSDSHSSSEITEALKVGDVVGCLVEFNTEPEEKKEGKRQYTNFDRHRTVTFFVGDKKPLVLTNIPLISYSLAVHLDGEAEVIINFGPLFNSLPEKARNTWVSHYYKKLEIQPSALYASDSDETSDEEWMGMKPIKASKFVRI